MPHRHLCLDKNFFRCGGTELLAGFEPESLDGIIAFNVLAYLDPDEEAEFYTQACRIVKNGGFLLVSHSNELFDLFALNSYTASFFIRHLGLLTRDGVIIVEHLDDNPLPDALSGFVKFKKKRYGTVAVDFYARS